jgi:hypothetical protein
MKVGGHVRKAIDDWLLGEPEPAMMHACAAVDGTAAKVYPNLGSKTRFTRLLRENYAVFGPMGAPGIDLEASRFPISVKKPTAPGGEPDMADVIYGIHRCCQAHGDELPDGFELLPDAAGRSRRTRLLVEKAGKMRLSDRTIFGLLAVAVLSEANVDQTIPDRYTLSYGHGTVMRIHEWWGRAGDFVSTVATDPPPGPVKLDFGEWMRNATTS